MTNGATTTARAGCHGNERGMRPLHLGNGTATAWAIRESPLLLTLPQACILLAAVLPHRTLTPPEAIATLRYIQASNH